MELVDLERSTINLAFNCIETGQESHVHWKWNSSYWKNRTDEKRTLEGKVYLGLHNNVLLSKKTSGYIGQVRSSGTCPSHIDLQTYEAFNYLIKRSDHPNKTAYDKVCEKARTGERFTEQGSADVPALLEGHSPVLWDENRHLRDHKHPTPGPSETRKPNRHHTQVVHRYIYDGKQVAQRETYRNHRTVTEPKPGTLYPRYDGKYWLTDYTQPEVTRFVPTLHGNSSGMVYCDADGTMDVSLSDGLGRPWYMYRAREGARQFATSDHQKGQNSGILKPMALPTGCEHLSFKPWQLHAVEPDILMGRRGVLGWDGQRYSSGLLMNGPIVNPPELGLWERVHLMWERDPLQTIGYVTIGTAAVVAGVAVTIGTGGLAGFVIGGAMAGFGTGFGVAGAATHDANAALQAGAIGAAAGAVGGAASFGAAGLFGGVAAIGGMSLGGQIVAGATMGAAGGFAGGFTGGTIGGLAAGQSGWDALQSGWQAGKTGAMWGAAIGAAVPVVIRGAQLAGRGLHGLRRWWLKGSENDSWYRGLKWRQQLAFDSGEKAIPDHYYNQIKHMNPRDLGKAAEIKRLMGWKRHIPYVHKVIQLIPTGPTPSVRIYGPKLLAALATWYLIKKTLLED